MPQEQNQEKSKNWRVNSFTIIAVCKTEFIEMTDRRGKRFHELRVETKEDYPQQLRIRFYSLTDDEIYQNPKGLTVFIYGSMQGRFYNDNGKFHDWLVLRGGGISIVQDPMEQKPARPMDQAVVEEDDLPF